SSGERYSKIIEVIKSTKNWARLSESSYAVLTSDSPSEFYEKFKGLVGSGDKFLVFSLGGSYFGRHSKEVVEWLKDSI
ncbi:TPA: hypothetical protein ACKQAS_003050, partial [Stenotrophomonas maltophilia]